MRPIIKTTVALLTMLNIAAFAQTKGTFKDTRDGKVYKTVKIGTQTWMAENLNYNVSGSKCYGEDGQAYNYDSGNVTTLTSAEIQSNCNKYGRLYDWNMAKKACPKGWHLPSNAEWDKLYRFADGTSGKESPYNYYTASKYLKTKEGWNDYEGESGNGEDRFGFSALPGGLGYSDGDFLHVGYLGIWLSSSENRGHYGYGYTVIWGVLIGDEDPCWDVGGRCSLYSVRCVRD
jgi:uncharacterized protein (TIGR02145 family)